MYVHMYIYTYMCMCIYICICICMSRRLTRRIVSYICSIAATFRSQLLSKRVAWHSHTYTYIIYVYTHTQIYIYTNIHIHTHIHIHIHIHKHTYRLTYTYTHIYIHIHTDTYTYVSTIGRDIPYTYTHIYIHVHTYTYRQQLILKSWLSLERLECLGLVWVKLSWFLYHTVRYHIVFSHPMSPTLCKPDVLSPMHTMTKHAATMSSFNHAWRVFYAGVVSSYLQKNNDSWKTAGRGNVNSAGRQQIPE